MKIKCIDKHYLYLRDGGKCFFCDRVLKYDKVSIDHYLPKSEGGTDDIFNLVTSCKSCNGNKRNQIPEDYEKKHLEWFIQGVCDHKILCANGLKFLHSDAEKIALSVKKSYASGEFTVFESCDHRIYVKEGRISKIVIISQRSDD